MMNMDMIGKDSKRPKEKGPLNLLTTPNSKLRAAFGFLEMQPHFWDWSLEEKNEWSVWGAFQRFEQLMDHDRLDGIDDDSVYTIYGAGGYHRYFVYPDGSIIFSKMHCSCPKRDHPDPEKLGFRVL